jgi:hypothetical protein
MQTLNPQILQVSRVLPQIKQIALGYEADAKTQVQKYPDRVEDIHRTGIPIGCRGAGVDQQEFRLLIIAASLTAHGCDIPP